MAFQKGDYDIEFSGLKPGKHEFIFRFDPAFFSSYENCLVEECEGISKVILEKHSEELMNLEFEISGNMALECVRCLSGLSYSFKDNYHLEIRVGEAEEDIEENINEDVLIINADTRLINVADHIYELVMLQLPMKPACDMAGNECSEEMISVLNKYKGEDQPLATGTDPRWKELDKLKNK